MEEKDSFLINVETKKMIKIIEIEIVKYSFEPYKNN